MGNYTLRIYEVLHVISVICACVWIAREITLYTSLAAQTAFFSLAVWAARLTLYFSTLCRLNKGAFITTRIKNSYS